MQTTRMNNTTLYHDPKMASKSSLAPKDKSFHMSKNTKISDFGISNKKTYDNQKPSTVEEEQISNMQQQVYLLESENKLLHDREGEREKLMGLELSDGQPLNEHMVQLKLKYERCKSDLENAIENKKGMKNDMQSNINALKLELEKSQGNCTQLKKKADKTQMRIEEENTTFRERKDEIQNEVSRCAKTNKQATNDLLETKNEVNELINKKREIERKIEDDNKKFREIEGEKIKKITELNRDLAAAQERFALLQIDKRDDVSVKDISSKCRELQIDIDEKKSQVETEKGNVIKTEKQIEVMEEMIKSNQDTIAKKEMTLKRLNNEITELKDDKQTEALKQRVENHEKVMINKLRIETDQEQIRTDEFFDYIKRIETDTNKYRNSYIKECNDKDELKNSQGKLDDQYKKQAGEISRLMHECAEKELILKDLSEKEERMAKELSALKINDSKNEMKIRQMKSEIETLREKSNNMERFKNIDFEEISSIQNNNMKMSNHIADFINKFQGSKSYRDSNNNNNDHR